jgi:hypothetical protein
VVLTKNGKRFTHFKVKMARPEKMENPDPRVPRENKAPKVHRENRAM